jgi:hypothetical protein
MEFELGSEDRHRELRVTFLLPTALQALQGLINLRQRAEDTPSDTASQALAASAALQFLEATRELPPPQRVELRSWAAELGLSLVSGQGVDGGWGDSWGGTGLNDVTQHGLSALLALRAAGIGIREESISRAAAIVTLTRPAGPELDVRRLIVERSEPAAVAAALAVLANEDSARYERVKRDAVRYLLHIRDPWADWGDAIQTAHALRALFRVGPGPRNETGTVVARLDGRPLPPIAVQPSEALAAAQASRSIVLPNLEAGHHTLEVAYDGPSAARVVLRIETWRP